MNFSKNYSKIYDVFEIEDTDFYVEICRDSFEPKNVEVWLCCETYGEKDLMFSIEKSDDYLEIIEANVEDYIKDFLAEYDDEKDRAWKKFFELGLNEYFGG